MLSLYPRFRYDMSLPSFFYKKKTENQSQSVYDFISQFYHKLGEFPVSLRFLNLLHCCEFVLSPPFSVFGMGPLHDPVTWYRINYAGTQAAQLYFQNKHTRTSPARLSFFFFQKVPLCNFRPSIINFAPCDWILQRVYREIPKNLGLIYFIKAWVSTRKTTFYAI